jgi:hypothetical protein
MVGIPIAQALTGLFNAGSTGPTGNAQLQHWVFTSTLRQAYAYSSSSDTPSEAALLALGFRPDATSFDLAPGFSVSNSMTPNIVMAINPKSVTFDQPKRFTRQDTRDGSVFFHWTNKKGQNNDILVIKFAGNTGNIDLRGDLALPSSDQTGAMSKLQVFLNLWQLTREPMLLGNNTTNVFALTYSSQALPVPITFSGFFNQVMSFEESADKPNSRDYSFEFTVTNTEPDLDTYIEEVTFASANAPADATDVSSLFGVSVDSSKG